MKKKIIKSPQQIYPIAILLGLLTGYAGAIFQLSIVYLNHWLVNMYQQEWATPSLQVLITICVVLIAYGLVKFFAKDASGSGIPEVEGALLHQLPIIWYRILPVKFIGGILAISSKMVVGREGPTVQMGGSLGEMLSGWFKLTIAHRDALVAAGAGAGLATAFNAPIAGILFVLEELRHAFPYSIFNLKIVTLCSAVAILTRNTLMGSDPVIFLKEIYSIPITSLWIFIVFGFFMSAFGMIFNHTLMNSLYLMDKLGVKTHAVFVAFVALIVGVCAIYFPDWVGDGYNVMHQSLIRSPMLSSLCVLIFIRFCATIVCYNTGVPGGIFAPMIALGTLLGLAFFQLMQWAVHASISPQVFAVAGMGGLFAASVRAPLTGIMLVVEMTQNYSLAPPLMVTCLASSLLIQRTNYKPIYTLLLNRKLQKTGQTCE